MRYFNCLLLGAVALYGLNAEAQDEKTASKDSSIIKKDITIQKAYVPTLRDASKINETPAVDEPDFKQQPVNYTQYSTLLNPPYDFHQLDAARLKIPQSQIGKKGFLRLGMGNYWGTLADFMYPIVNTALNSFDITINHKGTFSDRKHHKTDVDLSYRHFYKNGSLFAKGGYSFEGFNYYGDNKSEEDSDYTVNGQKIKGKDYYGSDAAISFIRFGLGYETIKSADQVNSLTATFGYKGFLPNVGLTEHDLNTHVNVTHKFDNGSPLGVDLNLENLVYGTSNVSSFAPTSDGYTIFKINPYYEIRDGTWFLHLGGKAYMNSGSGKSFAPMADIRALVSMFNKMLYLYGGIEGDYKTNSVREMETENHFVNMNTNFTSTYTPVDLYGGLKLKLLYNCLTDISVHYKKIEDQYFFVNDSLLNSLGVKVYGNTFGVNYSDAELVTAQLRMNYNYNQLLSFLLAFGYNSWSVDEGEAWQMPKFEFNFGTDVKLGDRLSTNLNAYVATGRKALKADGSTKTLDAKIDLNLGINYVQSSRLSIFLKFNNLLNRHYDQWYGYDVNGLNAMLGLTFTL